MDILFTATAESQLEKLPKNIQKRIAEKMRWFAAQENPLSFARPLTGTNAYRFRIGDYRIIFETATARIYVLLIKKRDKAYGDL